MYRTCIPTVCLITRSVSPLVISPVDMIAKIILLVLGAIAMTGLASSAVAENNDVVVFDSLKILRYSVLVEKSASVVSVKLIVIFI